ncbi:MAG: DUF4376 domain-containing protein [Phascolarctobacterium succinatutens]|uniref:DUF4376 domain-containing protein n=1 Tax=Phascolarctobacterium succinatutens TaxID=626940 RepID=UPI002E759F51|nr:DUF4376 domain-containing protein [Phascolarctobacterium succinatutens]MEE0357819.1 DUF4376 domain-containing protein [Phascolarctobacterium succinatutens]
MRLFQILNNQVIIVKDEIFYNDTVENYILDEGVVEKNEEKIYVAVYDSQQDYCEVNGMALPYPNDFFENIIDSIDTLLANKEKREYVAPTFDELKVQKLTELKATRDTLETEPIEYNGNLFDFDDKARDRINAAIIALSLQGEGATIEWTTADNADTPVTATDLKMIIAAVAVRSKKLHTAYRIAKEKVEEATTVADVEAVIFKV